MQTDWEWDWTTRRSWKSSWKDCFLFKTLKKKYNPKLERINKVTSLPEHHWYHLQSISDISEVRCLHRAQTKRQHPPSHSLFTLLPSDNRYTSSCCQTTTTSSFTPKTLWLMYKPVLQNRKWIKEDCFFFFFLSHLTSYCFRILNQVLMSCPQLVFQSCMWGLFPQTLCHLNLLLSSAWQTQFSLV